MNWHFTRITHLSNCGGHGNCPCPCLRVGDRSRWCGSVTNAIALGTWGTGLNVKAGDSASLVSEWASLRRHQSVLSLCSFPFHTRIALSLLLISHAKGTTVGVGLDLLKTMSELWVVLNKYWMKSQSWDFMVWVQWEGAVPILLLTGWNFRCELLYPVLQCSTSILPVKL